MGRKGNEDCALPGGEGAFLSRPSLAQRQDAVHRLHLLKGKAVKMADIFLHRAVDLLNTGIQFLVGISVGMHHETGLENLLIVVERVKQQIDKYVTDLADKDMVKSVPLVDSLRKEYLANR